jgi:energy-coupling factor transport system ATP-binding protein
VAAYVIEGLTFAYPERPRPALDGVDLEFRDGDFTVLCGPSGGGKTTLLRHLKPCLTPHGRTAGAVNFRGRAWADVTEREQAAQIGFVSQTPDNQIVTDKVWHELAFGLESLGVDNQTMRLRVAEMASFFGLQDWFERNVTELSGGQKQLLNLASVMATQPVVLILDEPTSQLDPIAAAEFLATLKKVNLELGTTVILTEHRLEEAFPLADQVVVLDQGKVTLSGAPADVCRAAVGAGGAALIRALPSAAQIYAGVQGTGDCPITVRDGRRWLEGRVPPVERQPSAVAGRSSAVAGRSSAGADPSSAVAGRSSAGADPSSAVARPPSAEAGRWSAVADPSSAEARPESPGTRPESPGTRSSPAEARPASPGRRPAAPWKRPAVSEAPALDMSEVWFKYDKNGPDVLRDFTLAVPQKTLFAVLGGNGVGKSTALGVVGGLLKAYRGKTRTAAQPVLLPQNPQTVFTKKTVALNLAAALAGSGARRGERLAQATAMAERVGLGHLLDVHPYDLSGGEQQRAALAQVLLLEPEILLLDEPTKGLDAAFKETLAGILKGLVADGVTVVMVSHDIEFCARHADRCALLFNGGVVSEGSPKDFFAGHGFYTTAANRIARSRWPDAITVEEVVRRCRTDAPGSL